MHSAPPTIYTHSGTIIRIFFLVFHHYILPSQDNCLHGENTRFCFPCYFPAALIVLLCMQCPIQSANRKFSSWVCDLSLANYSNLTLLRCASKPRPFTNAPQPAHHHLSVLRSCARKERGHFKVALGHGHRERRRAHGDLAAVLHGCHGGGARRMITWPLNDAANSERRPSVVGRLADCRARAEQRLDRLGVAVLRRDVQRRRSVVVRLVDGRRRSRPARPPTQRVGSGASPSPHSTPRSGVGASSRPAPPPQDVLSAPVLGRPQKLPPPLSPSSVGRRR